MNSMCFMVDVYTTMYIVYIQCVKIITNWWIWFEILESTFRSHCEDPSPQQLSTIFSKIDSNFLTIWEAIIENIFLSPDLKVDPGRSKIRDKISILVRFFFFLRISKFFHVTREKMNRIKLKIKDKHFHWDSHADLQMLHFSETICMIFFALNWSIPVGAFQI